MPLRSDSLEEPQLNLTPMIDVVLNLVIFFMLGTQFVDNERKFDVNLPLATDAQPLTERPDELVINISKTGEIALGSEVLTMEALRQKLVEAQAKYADQAVVIRGDMDCVYQQVVSVLDVCKQAKIRQIDVATRVDRPSS
jgi:biopolymer transport protein ExbD